MASIDRPPAKGNLGPFAVRTEGASDRPPPPGSGKLGFHFDALPEAVYDDYRAGWLKPIDLAVVVEMIRWGARRGRRDSCWTCRKVIARAIDRDPRTVQLSWSRLAKRGWIERVMFEGEGRTDPDDPDNHTGSRIYFNWVGHRRPVRDPAEVPPPRRRRGRPRKAGAAAEKFVSPPRETDSGATAPAPPGLSISPIPGKSISPKEEDLIPRRDGETLNVAALAGMGDGEPMAAIEPRADGKIPPAAAPGGVTEGPDRPPPAAAGPPAPIMTPPPAGVAAWGPYTPGELAEKLVTRIRARGLDLRVELDPEGAEVIRLYRLSGSPSAVILQGEAEQISGLRPHVLAYLKGGKAPSPAMVADGRSRPVRPVPKEVRARVVAMIGRLPDNPALVDDLVGELSRALGDDKSESRGLYRGLAEEVRAGTKPVDLLISAFEWGCGRGEHRGKLFTAGVNDWLRRNGGGRPPSPECRPR